jgi:AraC-like DNA-binding protein
MAPPAQPLSEKNAIRRPDAAGWGASCYQLSVSQTGDAPPPWLTRLRNTYAIHNVTAMRPSLPFWVIRRDANGELDWMELGEPTRALKPFHFEIHFGRQAERDAYYAKCLDEAKEAEGPIVRQLFCWGDIFCPLASSEGGDTFLYAGQFLSEAPTWKFLAERWRELSGHDPAGANPDFVRFVRMALTLPVLEQDVIEALGEFMQLYTQFLGARDEETIHTQVDELNGRVFDRLWPIDDWVRLAISSEKFQLTPWGLEGELADWMKTGMGISRLPTTAMALMPVDPPNSKLDPTQLLVRNAEIQRACVAFARNLSETAATPLQDYGVSIITSVKRGKSAARARLELRERAQAFQEFVRENFSVSCVVGIGGSNPPGGRLHESHREAVLALHMCVQLDQKSLFHDEHDEGERFAYSALHKAALALIDAFVRENPGEIKLASDRYVRLVLMYAQERVEIVRGQLLAMLFQILDAIQRRHPMNEQARDQFAQEVARELEGAHALAQIIEGFKGALQRMSFVSSRVLEGPKLMRIEAILNHLRENFAEALRLPEVARRAGMSVPAFSRAFKQATGTSFLAYLRVVRVEHAKRLLTSTQLTTEQIAQACGFQSQHHLIRSFKKVTNQTPGAYRRAEANKRAQS